jgi:hypothetical protein
MKIESEKKERFDQTKKSNVILNISIFVLIFSVVGLFISNIFLKKAGAEKIELEKELTEMMTTEKKELESEVLSRKRKIDEFSSLFNNHLLPSKVFGVIQKSTHPQTWFSDFDLSSDKGDLEVSGETKSFETLEQQIYILEAEPSITKVSIDDFSINEEGEISFKLIIHFKGDFFISK